jgi:hypothetical protein
MGRRCDEIPSLDDVDTRFEVVIAQAGVRRVVVDRTLDLILAVETPIGSALIRYWPWLPVTTATSRTCSAGLAAVTVTPGSTAPLSSVTTPMMLACVSVCADALKQAAPNIRINTETLRQCLPSRSTGVLVDMTRLV